MNKQSAFIIEESDEKIVKENLEEKLKELKRKRNRERQRAFYYRQKDLKKNEKKQKNERKKKEAVPKSNAERQKKFRQRNAEKSKRQKLDSNEDNVVQCRAVENIENVTPQKNLFHKTECTTALDKFKRRLVRDIARRVFEEKQTEDEMFEQLKNEYGCDCKLLWDHMKSLTQKKLKRLLTAEDRSDYITKIARMTFTDWLTFDLVLVHEKLDVIGEDIIAAGKSEPTVHSLLFELVQKHDIEGIAERVNTESESLSEAWFTLTQEYNTDGRECSPMLLQRRWYQLKEAARTRIYDFWKIFRGNPKLYEKALARKPTQLQTSMIKAYPAIVIGMFEPWEDLIKKKKVILASAFETMTRKNAGQSDSEPDLIVIEPKVETIELAADTDSDEEKMNYETNSDLDSMPGDGTVAVNIETTNSINIDQTTHIDESEEVDMTPENEQSNSEHGERQYEPESAVENDILMPKITSVMGSVQLAEFKIELNSPVGENIQVLVEKCVETPCEDGDDDVQIISAPLSKDSNPIDDDPVGEGSFTLDDIKISNITGDINEVVDIDEDNVKIHSLDGNMSDLPHDLKFVDDGIELIDDTNYEMENNLSNKQGQDCEKTEENDNESLIDPKLIMFPITYTRKIDDMNVFKNSCFLTVKGNDIIECALAESKPIFMKAVNEEQSEEENDEALKPIPRLKFSSWRLQKPKNRSYNPIQLCKNPDFNTRLKKLTVGFFSSERNRLQFSVCKPLTIDLHKGFEDSLVDNTLFLDTTNSPMIMDKRMNNIEACKKTVSVIPSAMAVQCLLDDSKLKVQQLLKTKEERSEEETLTQCDQETPEEQIGTNIVAIEKHKVVKLPNIERIRHQNLLVAEVSPMPVQNNTPPVQLVNAADRVSPQLVSVQSNAISSQYSAVQELNEELRSINYVQNNYTKRFMKKKLVSIPKLKPTNVLPAWTQPSTHCPISEESLITTDTLEKMLCLLSGSEVPKIRKRFRKKSKVNDKKLVSEEMNKETNKETDKETNKETNEETNKEILKNSTPEANKSAVVVNDEIDLTKGTLRKRRRFRAVRTVSSKSGYCCWAQYRIYNIHREQKLRHLCPKPFCKCCCRNLLVNKMLYEQGLCDKLLKGSKIFIQKFRNSLCSDESPMNENLQQSDIQNNLENPDHTSPTQIDITSVGDINSTYTVQSHILNYTPLSYVSSESATLARETIEAANSLSAYDDSLKHLRQGIPLIKTRVVSGPWPTKSINVAGEMVKSFNNEPSNLQPDTENGQPNNNTEPIIVIDEDETQNECEPENRLANAELILPKGVNIVLLPDKRVSVAIDPNVEVDPAKLAKVPQILLSVQKYFADFVITTQNDSNSVANLVINTSEENSQDNSNNVQTVATDNIVNRETVPNIIQDSDITDVGLNVTASQNENAVVKAGNDIKNDANADYSQHSNTYPGILKTTEQIVESTHSYISASPIQTETENHSQNTQENTENESDVTSRSTGRTTILSDLMAMSGISQEDSTVAAEEPFVTAEEPFVTAEEPFVTAEEPFVTAEEPFVTAEEQFVTAEEPFVTTEEPFVNPLHTTMKPVRILTYSKFNKAVDLFSERKIITKGKPLKKFIVSIRKKQNVPLISGSVIDLTEDCDNSNIEEKNHSQENDIQLDDTPKKTFQNTATIQSQMKTTQTLNNEEKTSPTFETPHKVFKPRIISKKLFLTPKKSSTKSMPFKIVRSNDISSRSYKEVDLNHTFKMVDIRMDKRKKSNKHLVLSHYETYDSSDEEPLAKKMKRIRSSSVKPTSNDNIIPIQPYNVAAEFSTGPVTGKDDIDVEA